MLPSVVNFFGHAAIASWHAPDQAGVALGAMLPDFASMCGGRLDAQVDPPLAVGVELHHATDAVFHRAPVVVGLFREASERLTARGVRRGPTRAAAHVGVELLLDGVWLDDAAHRRGFLDALAYPAPVRWRDDGDDARYRALHGRVRAYGLPTDLLDGDGVARRLARTLAGRPLLAPTADEVAAIAAVMTELVARVAAAAPTVLTQVRAALRPD